MRERIRKLCLIAVFCAIICALAPLTIPMPIGVPLTLQTFIISVTAFLLGAKSGTAAVICYILLGVAGLPVFSGFGAGAGVLLSPTGGFIFAFPLFALILSFAFYVNKITLKILIGLSAVILLYAAGTVQFTVVTGNGFSAAVGAFLLYFVKDVAVIFAAYFLCVRIRPIIKKSMQPK